MTSFAALFKVTAQNWLRLLNKLLLVIVISFLLTLFSQRI